MTAESAATPELGEADAAALVDALAQTAFAVMAVLTRIAGEHDLSLTQLRVFGILRDHRPRIAELADYLGLDKSTMSGLISRAERRGLLERCKDPRDARATDVVMTPVALAMAERLQAQVHTALAPLTGQLPTPDRHALTHLLTRMLSAPQATAPDPPPAADTS